MIISAIVACSDNNVIGINNELPWHLPNDLKFFKRTTTDHTIIMGRKTFESIGKPLPNRTNIIISRNPEFRVEGARVFENIPQAIQFCESKAYDEIFFIGGAEIYQQCLQWSDKLYLTKVHTTIQNGTAFFPEIDWNQWKLIDDHHYPADEKNSFDHTIEIYLRSE